MPESIEIGLEFDHKRMIWQIKIVLPVSTAKNSVHKHLLVVYSNKQYKAVMGKLTVFTGHFTARGHCKGPLSLLVHSLVPLEFFDILHSLLQA